MIQPEPEEERLVSLALLGDEQEAKRQQDYREMAGMIMGYIFLVACLAVVVAAIIFGVPM